MLFKILFIKLEVKICLNNLLLIRNENLNLEVKLTVQRWTKIQKKPSASCSTVTNTLIENFTLGPLHSRGT